MILYIKTTAVMFIALLIASQAQAATLSMTIHDPGGQETIQILGFTFDYTGATTFTINLPDSSGIPLLNNEYNGDYIIINEATFDFRTCAFDRWTMNPSGEVDFYTPLGFPCLAQSPTTANVCGGNKVVLNNTTVASGQNLVCSAITNISAGNMTMNNTSFTELDAPNIGLYPGFRVQNGAELSIQPSP